MNDREIGEHLHWLYHERELCRWCRHPTHRPYRRNLCRSCYRLANDFRKRPTPALAVAIDFARHEGVINAADWKITGLELELLLERVANMAFAWRKVTDNPFWHSANTWSHSLSHAQRRLLFHHFSMVERELTRKSRRAGGWGKAFQLELEGKSEDLEDYIQRAKGAVDEVLQ